MDEQFEADIPDDILIQVGQQCQEVMEKAEPECTTSMEMDIPDDILIQASQQCEKIIKSTISTEMDMPNGDTSSDEFLIQASQQWEAEQQRFSIPVTSEAVESAIISGVPEKTKASNLWALNVWKACAKSRKINPVMEEKEKLHPLDENFVTMSIDSISFWLPKFILEVRKENSECYPPSSLHGICCGLQRSI